VRKIKANEHIPF